MTDNTSRRCGRPGEYFVDDAEMTVVESVEAIVVVVAPRRNTGTLIVNPLATSLEYLTTACTVPLNAHQNQLLPSPDLRP